MFDTYNVWWASVIIVIVVVLSALFILIIYSYLISRMPKAVWLKRLEIKLLTLEEKVDLEEKHLKSILAENQEQKKLAEKLKNEVKTLLGQKKAFEDQKKYAEDWLIKHKDDVAKIDMWTKKIAILTDQLTELEKKLLDDQQKREKAMRETSEAEVKLQAINSKVAELKNSESTITANVEALNNEYNECRAKIAEIKINIAEDKVRLEKLQSELMNLEKAIDIAREKLLKTENEKRSAEKELREAVAIKEGVKKEISAHQKTLDSLGNMVANMDAQIQNFKPPKILERLEDFRRPVFTDEAHIFKEDEQVMLEAFQDTLESSGYIFHERIIHSFHTSLKIADIAPLVVLAGILGTGKANCPACMPNIWECNS